MLVNVSAECSACGASRLVSDDEIGRTKKCKACARPLVLQPRFGKYHVREKINEGGMGAVYLAHDDKLRRLVALKVPFPSLWRNDEFLKRFKREAIAAARFNHPNFCPIHDVGQIGSIPYLDMAFIQGETLAAMMDREGAIPIKTAVEITRRLATAMTEAHRQGIVHRDLKPSNIMIDARGEFVIMDFGLACLTDVNDTRLTLTGEVLGTPVYMAPEIIKGEHALVGPSSDVYSLGVILFRLLTGVPPFRGNRFEIFEQIEKEETPRVSTLRPEVGPVLEAVCRRAMAKSLANRLPTMDQLALVLGDFLLVTGSESSAESGSAKPAGAVATAKGEEVTTVVTVYPAGAGARAEPGSTDALALSLREVPAGEFEMGMPVGDPRTGFDQSPKRLVKISRPFLIGVHPVTQLSFDALLDEKPSAFSGSNRPVDSVSWFDAIRFCNALSERSGLPCHYAIEGDRVGILGGDGYRLPTEAEWEYACRAGKPEVDPSGEGLDRLAEYAWFGESFRQGSTHSVGRKRANDFGIFDMLGNVWEWCWDRYVWDYYKSAPSVDPSGPLAGDSRVLRGGAFDSSPETLHAAFRQKSAPGRKGRNIGFRVARNSP